jgi:cell division protein FtsQ
VAEDRPQRRARARAAVIPLETPVSGVPILRALPSGRSLLLGFALVSAAVGLYALARYTPMFALRTIEVEGAPPAVAARVRAALEPLTGTSLLALRAGDVEQAVNRLPEVAAVRYDRDFPHTLRVVVRPEIPVAVARRGAQAWLISTASRVISPIPLGTHRSLPRVWLGADTTTPEPGTLLADRQGLRAVRALALAHRARFRLPVRFVRVHEQELTFLLGSGLELRLGDLRAVRLKLAVASVVVPELRDGGYTYLDVSVPRRPVASMNSQPEG